MKKLGYFSINTRNLGNKMTDQYKKKLLIPSKSCFFIQYIYTNVDKVEIVLVLHDKVGLLTRRGL